MKRIPRGIYTQEFRAQAVSLDEADVNRPGFCGGCLV